MNIFFYIIIFIIGTLFGSFYTLAVYRIPKRQDILYTHSYCTNCNHKLGLLDLFPIFSYIFLRGKCRYCKNKIRPRYLILEILSGILFVTISYLIGMNINHLTSIKIVELSFLVLYLTFIILLSGIDKENRKIDKAVNIYGIVIAIIYMVYLCIVEKANIYRYVIYLALLCILLAVDTCLLKKKGKNYDWLQVLTLVIYTILFTGEYVFVVTCLFFLLCIPITIFIHKITSKRAKYVKTDKQVMQDFRFGFYFCTINLIVWIVTNFYITYMWRII